MSTARDYLAAVQQRADAASEGPWEVGHGWVYEAAVHTYEPGEGLRDVSRPGRWAVPEAQEDADLRTRLNNEFIAAARTDVPRLVAALVAALDLADDPQRHKVALGHVDRDDLLAVITDALTPKENDS